jgi:photosystem II stability/assembly factor-like uncharacterized protein
MKRIITILILLILCSFTHAQWVPDGGPYSGTCNCFAVSGSNLFVGTSESGVFISTNDGASWTSRNNGLTNSYVHALTICGNNIFAGMGNGVFLSTNKGNSWTDTQFPIPNYITSFTVNGNNIFAGSQGGGVFLSTNNGINWTSVNTGITNQNIWAITYTGTNLFAATDAGVFRSTDNGSSWTAVGLYSYPVISLVFSVGQSENVNLFAGTYLHGVFLSTDNGTSWASADSGLTSSTFASLVTCPDGNGGTNLYAGTSMLGYGVYLSTNNGTSWSLASSGLNYKTIYSLAFTGSNLLAGTWGGGVYRSTDYGHNWTTANSGITPNTSISTIVTNGTNIFAVSGSSRLLNISKDNGINWTPILYGSQAPCNVSSLLLIGNNIFAGTDGYGFWESSDNGSSWTKLYSWVNNVYTLAANGTNFYEGGKQGLYLSTNNGLNWNSLVDGSIREFLWGIFDIALSETNVFAETMDSIYCSTDNGSSWYTINSILPRFPDKLGATLAICGSNLFAGTANGVYLSSNIGTSWIPVNNGLPPNTSFPTITVMGTNIFAATNKYSSTDAGSVFLTTNYGTNWTDVSAGLPHDSINFGVNSLTLNGTNLLAGTNNKGIWSRPLSELTGISKEQTVLPKDYTLSQNYPNPFNPSTTITYSLPHSGNVKLTVYNSIGSKVATIVNEYKPAGNYSVNFNGSNLASGIYLYRMESGNYSAAKKFILMK